MVVAGPFQYDVFLSYTGADRARVAKLYDRLIAENFTVWMDQRVEPMPTNIPVAVTAGLRTSRVAVLCLTPSYFVSDWCTLEWTNAMHRDPANKEGRLIPVVFETCDTLGDFAPYGRVDWRGETDAAFAELCARCRRGTTEESRKTYPAASAKHEKRLAQLEAEVSTTLNNHSEIKSALLAHDRVERHCSCRDANDVTRVLIYCLTGYEVALVFNYVHEEMVFADATANELKALCDVLWRLLALCSDWREHVWSIRSKLDANHPDFPRAFELQTGIATVAECIMAGVDGRSVYLEHDPLASNKAPWGRSAVSVPPTKLFIDPDAALAVEAVVHELANLMKFSTDNVENMHSDVQNKLAYHEEAPPRTAHPYYLLFVDRDYTTRGIKDVTFRWDRLCAGLKKALPKLRLLRLDGTATDLMGEHVLAILDRSAAPTKPSKRPKTPKGPQA